MKVILVIVFMVIINMYNGIIFYASDVANGKVEVEDVKKAKYDEVELQKIADEINQLSRKSVDFGISEKKRELEKIFDDNPELEEKYFGKHQGEVVDNTDEKANVEEEEKYWEAYGDILINNGSTNSSFYFGHAAIAHFNEGWTIESCPAGKCHGAQKHGVQERSNYIDNWLQCSKYNEKWGRYRVNGASEGDYSTAVKHAYRQIGKPYSYFFVEIAYGFYCSELVKFSWLSAGHIINQGGGRNEISPYSIANCDNTRKIEGDL